MFLFRLVWLFQYGGSYEQTKFSHNTADAVTLIFFLMTSTILIDFLIPPFRSYIHGPTLIFALIYLWSKQNPTAPISLFGLIKLQALYLPFAFMGITVLQGGSPFPELLGILVGHLYYFLTDVYPVQSGSGRVLIRSPQWLLRRMHKYNIGTVPDQRGAAANPSDVTFRAFSGRPRRLAD
jgi:Derlin-2/3